MAEPVCACCGTPVPPPGEQTTGMLEAPDFDTRPGEPARSTIANWVSRCPGCQYCSADLSHVNEGSPEFIASARYRAELEDPSLPVKAREFVCYALILEHAGQHADAGWSMLHAAWVCDDEDNEAGSKSCRRHALEAWKRGKQKSENFGDDLASEFALAADVYRRAGDFEMAVVTCSEALDMEDLPSGMELLLRRQKSFIERRDSGRHSLAELAAGGSGDHASD